MLINPFCLVLLFLLIFSKIIIFIYNLNFFFFLKKVKIFIKKKIFNLLNFLMLKIKSQ